MGFGPRRAFLMECDMDKDEGEDAQEEQRRLGAGLYSGIFPSGRDGGTHHTAFSFSGWLRASHWTWNTRIK